MRYKHVCLNGLLAVASLVIIQGCVILRMGGDEIDTGRIRQELLAAYGGAERIGRVKSVRAQGRIDAPVLNDDGSYNRWFTRDRKLKVEVNYRRSSEIRILDGVKGYRGVNGMKPLSVSGAPWLAMVYQYKYLDMPYSLADPSYRIVYEGMEVGEGRKLDILKIEDDEGPEMRIFIDRKSRRIVKATGYFVAAGRKTDLTAEFSDFRTVDGVLMPFRIVNFGGGMKISEILLDTCVVNPVIDDAVFRPE